MKIKKITAIKSLHSYSLEIPTSMERLSTVDLFLEKIQKIHHINEEIFIKIDVILNETVNNAMVHGNKLEANKRVTISVDINDKEIILKVADEGVGFDPSYILEDSFEKNIHKIQERGLFIVKKLSDKLSFNKNGNEISVTINKS